METWFILTIVSIFLTGIGASIHRYILRDEHVYSYGFLFTFLSGLYFIPPLITEPIILPQTIGGWFLVLATAVLWWTVNVIGFTGVSKTESTLGKPLGSSKVLITVLLSIFVLGETMTLMRIIGTVLLIAGMLSLTWKKGWLNHLKDPGVQLILIGAVITGVIATLDKFNMGSVSPNVYGFMMYMIPAMLLGIMVSFNIPKLKQTIRNKWKPIFLVTMSYGVMYYFLLNAYRLADVSLVYPLYQLSTLITLGLGYLWLKEKTEFRQRVIGAILMISGAIIITVGI